MITRRRLLASSAVLPIVAGAPAIVSAQPVTKLRFAHAAAESHPLHIAAVEFKKSLERRLPGRVELQIFPNRQLGDDRQIMEGLMAGTIELGGASTVLVSLVTKRPAMDALQLPFLVDTYDNFEKLVVGDVGQKLLADLSGGGVVGLSVVDGGQRHFLSTGRPIRTTADFAGVKTRIVPVPLHKAIWEAAGTKPVGLPYGEVYGALQTKVIDAVEINVSSIIGENLWEVGKSMTLTGHYFWPMVLAANKPAFDRWPAELRAAVQAAGRDAVAPTIAYAKKQDFEGRDALKAKGVSIVDLTDLAQMRTKVEPILGQWAAKSPLIADFIKAARSVS